ncbi:MAG: hypothetical protein RIS92_3056 [Verrucomicrobiota bacterium]
MYGGLAKGLVKGATGMHRAGTGQSPCLLRVDEAERRLTPVMTSGLNITHYPLSYGR